jgi:hypothetical protein
MFLPGQEIVCICDEWRCAPCTRIPPGVPLPQKGNIYHFDGPGQSDGFIYLRDLPGPQSERLGFLADFFRPVAKRSTDISIFKKLLVPSDKIPEDA